jgi:hypothetical protein
MKKATVFTMLAILVGIVVGCSGGSSPAQDDKDLRAKLSKPKIDIKDVPPDQKAMVQGYIDRANEMRAKAQANGKH